MFMTILTFLVTGVIFAILHVFIDGIWTYYVPATLVVLSIWLKAIQPMWNADQFQMPVTKMEPSAAAGHLSVIAIVYGGVSLVLGNWIPLAICAVVFLFSLTMKFSHPY